LQTWCCFCTRTEHILRPACGFMASTDPQIQQFLTLDAYVLPSA